jgi:hypothetical protein
MKSNYHNPTITMGQSLVLGYAVGLPLRSNIANPNKFSNNADRHSSCSAEHAIATPLKPSSSEFFLTGTAMRWTEARVLAAQ